MTSEIEERYHVVRNHEEQYSIYPAALTPPVGWEIVGEAADKPTCLERIETLWQDLLPKSLRDAVAQER